MFRQLPIQYLKQQPAQRNLQCCPRSSFPICLCWACDCTPLHRPLSTTEQFFIMTSENKTGVLCPCEAHADKATLVIEQYYAQEDHEKKMFIWSFMFMNKYDWIQQWLRHWTLRINKRVLINKQCSAFFTVTHIVV